jgi:hypothetical protein
MARRGEVVCQSPPMTENLASADGSSVASGVLPANARHLPVWGFVVVVVGYLAVVQGIPYLTTSGMDIEYGKFPDSETVLRALVLPVGASAVFAAILVTILGWWRPVWKDDRPVQRWVRIVPVLLIATILLGTNYGELADHGIGYTALFLVGALLVGFAEETMFRGVGVMVFRSNGFDEAKVALWTCIIFGLAHGTNIFTEGPSAFVQVLVTAIAGYFFYLTRRATAGLLAAVVIHGLWDFGLLSGNLGENIYAGTLLFLLMDIVLVVILVVRRRHIELPPAERTWA